MFDLLQPPVGQLEEEQWETEGMTSVFKQYRETIQTSA